MTTPSGRSATIASWIAQLVAAAILAMASVSKLTGNPDSVALFQQLGAEPLGRYAVGLAEAAAVVLLLLPPFAAWGGLLAAGIMVGAVGSHLTVLGVTYGGDASLFMMALLVLAAGLTTAWLRRGSLRRRPAAGA
jgi:uncharacterized membrane protein YphA (DoxX/SURF4 family)